MGRLGVIHLNWQNRTYIKAAKYCYPHGFFWRSSTACRKLRCHRVDYSAFQGCNDNHGRHVKQSPALIRLLSSAASEIKPYSMPR